MQNPAVIGFLLAIPLVGIIFTFMEHSVSGNWWFVPPRFRPQPGDIRRKKFFLWRPKTINGIRRFWERAEIVQVYSGAGTCTGYDWSPAGWRDAGWGEFIESIDPAQPRISMFGTPRGEIKPHFREGVLVVFDERSV